ncbi:tRNA uridine-5-carboxymethylaminomethyl(34) synthesis GTPase MnmE, partial [Faecalibaculum rodentium]|uniref:tRNA uridine-5-carboxymethylaminomethyl(34) synthesis GTPase MnmE n=1 Tax=Faecalibaculum rodentium TaxID=1702221 RepID=UPI00256FDA55
MYHWAMLTKTIAAISTALQDGAISIIRLSGPDALAIADSVFSGDVLHQPANTIRYGTILKDGEPLDEVLLSVFRAPHSYSGMDMVEINAHGGVLITRRILQLLLSKGAVLAEPGEFTRQAFLTGRIDLAQAEAVNDMITATSDAGARIAVQGIRGSVRKLLEPLIDDILNIIAQIEVNIDYPEYEDVEELTSETLLPEITRWIDRIGRILERATFGQQVKKGIDTVILGRPNAGKSSLLNALLEEDKAIVTDIPGTTRDVVEGRVILDGIQLNLLDTAGIRETEDAVEKIGVERSRKAAREADLVILVRDPLATD